MSRDTRDESENDKSNEPVTAQKRSKTSKNEEPRAVTAWGFFMPFRPEPVRPVSLRGLSEFDDVIQNAIGTAGLSSPSVFLRQ